LRRPQYDALKHQVDALVEQIAALDAEAIERANRRRELVEQVKELRDQVWPIVPHMHGRRPPAPDERPLPPLRHDAEPLHGRRLRSVCLALLTRYGELPLAELHSHLHMHGYFVSGGNGVKRLADAMGYEVENHRLVRTRRGTYRRSTAFRPRPGRFGAPPLNPRSTFDTKDLIHRYRAVDPVLFESSERWYPDLPDFSGIP
jgi:hypothetical protein